jgi:ribonuclease J
MDKTVFLEPKNIAKTPSDKLIIFCTGSQGEEKAALSKLARQVYPGWKVATGDSIILTSSPIMDNKFRVEIINNKLFTLGAKIYENSPEDLLHASGHACQEDLKLMLKLVNPRHFMPFHGDFRMLKKHGRLARELGIPEKNIFVCQNGEVIEARGKEFFLSGAKVPAQPNFIFNQKMLPADELSNNLSLREKMSQAGVILVIILNDTKEPATYIFTYGFIDMKKNENLLNN